jgi:hypothetical protein
MNLAPPTRRFLQEPHGVTSQNTPFFKLITEEFRFLARNKFLVSNEDHNPIEKIAT